MPHHRVRGRGMLHHRKSAQVLMPGSGWLHLYSVYKGKLSSFRGLSLLRLPWALNLGFDSWVLILGGEFYFPSVWGYLYSWAMFIWEWGAASKCCCHIMSLSSTVHICNGNVPVAWHTSLAGNYGVQVCLEGKKSCRERWRICLWTSAKISRSTAA